jgi:hypothetical protein
MNISVAVHAISQPLSSMDLGSETGMLQYRTQEGGCVNDLMNMQITRKYDIRRVRPSQHNESTRTQEAQNQSINMTSSILLLGLWQRLLVCRLELDLDVGKNRHVVLSRNVSTVYPTQSRAIKYHLILHAELSLALRRPTNLVRVPKHVIQRHLRHTRELVFAALRIDDRTTTGVQAPNHGRLELDGCDDLDGHDRLENDRLGLGERLTEGTDGAETEGKLRRIDLMVSTVLEDEATAGDGITRERTLLESLVEAL